MSQAADPHDIPWPALRRGALIAAAAGLGVWALGWALAVTTDSPDLLRKAFFSYLFAFGFCLSVPLGSLPIWMLHNQTGGAWGLVIRRVLEAAARTVPFMALLFVPLAFGLPQVYPWADDTAPLHGHAAHLVHHRHAYLNVPAFLIRAAVYFGVWAFLAWRLDRWQAGLDRAWDPRTARRQQIFSGPGLVLYGLTVTLAAVDWYMSLETEFTSTIYGVLIAIAQLVPAMGFAIAASLWLGGRRPLAAEPAVDPETRADLGSLLLALVMLWAYVSFCQLLLVWAGNLSEEIPYYLRRSENGWVYVGVFLAIFYFAVPFALLLSRGLKRDPQKLAAVAALVVGMSVVHHFWLVTPVYAATVVNEHGRQLLNAGPLTAHWLDLAALVGLGGTTFSIFLWQLERRPLTPPAAPYAEEEAATHA